LASDFSFDRLFRTIGQRHRPFNRAGFDAARSRYGLIECAGKLVNDSDLSIYSKLPAKSS
jgi:hypothetical protein